MHCVYPEHGNRNGNEDQGLSSAPKDHDPYNLRNKKKKENRHECNYRLMKGGEEEQFTLMEMTT